MIRLFSRLQAYDEEGLRYIIYAILLSMRVCFFLAKRFFFENDTPCFVTTKTKCEKNTRLFFTLWGGGVCKKKGIISLLFIYEKESPVEQAVLRYFIHNYLNPIGYRIISHDTVCHGFTTAVLEGVQTS